MPTPRREQLVEATITATLFSIYAGARGTARALGFVQLFVRPGVAGGAGDRRLPQ